MLPPIWSNNMRPSIEDVWRRIEGEAGNPFHAAVADKLRRFIYSSGNSLAPAEAYLAFRDRPAGPEAMLRKRGLLEPA